MIFIASDMVSIPELQIHCYIFFPFFPLFKPDKTVAIVKIKTLSKLQKFEKYTTYLCIEVLLERSVASGVLLSYYNKLRQAAVLYGFHLYRN